MTVDKSPMRIFEFHLEDLIPHKGMEYFINERSLRLSFRISPRLEQLADAYLTRRGKASWTAPLRQRDAARNFNVFLKAVLAHNDEQYFPFIMKSRADNEVMESRLLRRPEYWTQNVTPYIPQNFKNSFERMLSVDTTYRLPNNMPNLAAENSSIPFTDKSISNKALGGFISLDIDDNDVLWVRPMPTYDLTAFITRALGGHSPLIARHRAPALMSPVEAQTFMDSAKNSEFFVLSDELAERMTQSRSLIGIGSFPGEPSSVAASVGSLAGSTGRARLTAGKTTKVSLARAESVSKLKPGKVLFHPDLHDIMAMRKAKPFNQDNLRDYQKEAVGLHLATKVGYVQTCSPGMGKTVMQLTAMRERARNIPNYRGLVVCEANVREQWKDEVKRWFPEASVTILSSGSDTKTLNAALATDGKPVVVLMSYSLTTPIKAYVEAKKEQEDNLREAARNSDFKRMQEILAQPVKMTLASLLMSTRWHDLCADEAVVIRTGNSKQYHAMWALRENADVAVPMSATPINTSIDDLLRLISWARGNRTMFSGIKFSYDMGTAAGAKKMFDTMSPLIFRRDTSEIKNEIPETNDKMQLIRPSAAEKALISAAEKELKRCYLELMAAMDELEKAGTVDAEELAKARLNLREANGAWLGGKQLARIATSDPRALMHSTSMGAALLQSQGLIEAAMQDDPTKLKVFLAQAQERVMKGEKILVFTSFNAVAESLTQALVDAGIKAKSFTGKNAKTRDAARVEFQNGELDVLVSTKAGTRGLTLHRASAIYHYDIPYTLEEVIQRTGRGVRIGSQNKDLDVVFMIMEDTIEHKVAESIVEQGITASLVLDGSRGRDLSKTETASTISGLLGAATSFTTGKNKNVLDFGKILGISKKDMLRKKESVAA